VLEQFKENWNELKDAEPGHRFRERYERRQRESQGKFNVGKFVNIIIGILITVVGIILIPAPGPGSLSIIFGLGFIASEFEPIARGLDWLEMRVRAVVDWAMQVWSGAPVSGKLLISAFLVACAAGFVFSGYQLVFGNSGNS